MIGNDIVDLGQARRESNWRRKGFLDKVFTTYEQQLIQSASDPDGMVWLLWSMKESAYKVIVRETGQRFFAPKKLVCFLRNSLSERVEGHVFYQKTYQTTSFITDRHIASVAFSTDAVQPVSQVVVSFDRTDYQYQHEPIREKIKKHYAVCFSIPERSIQIQKSETGIPSLIIQNSSQKAINRPLSLSHHGHFGAFVIPENPILIHERSYH